MERVAETRAPVDTIFPLHLHDNLVYGLFREAGVFASRTSYARLVVNGELLGLFALVEQIDGTFAKDFENRRDRKN